MVLQKLLSKRFFDGVKMRPFERSVVSSPTMQQQVIAPPSMPGASSADGGFLRRFFLLRQAVYHSSPARFPDFLSLPVGEKLREKLKGINNIAGIGDCCVALAPAPMASDAVFGSGMSVSHARKILRVPQMEKVKAKLRNVSESSVPYSEFLRICVETCENHEQGTEFAKILDESGNVIVLGKAVFLRPEEVAKSIESLIYQSIANPNDPRRKELELMEKQKWMIDEKAKAQVRAELYFGLGFLTVQTLGFMRLTFLGTKLGCDGAHMLLCYLIRLRSCLSFLPQDLYRTHLSGLLPSPALRVKGVIFTSTSSSLQTNSDFPQLKKWDDLGHFPIIVEEAHH
ncbi:hypothetical protein JHK87_048441 [Glycine soja]|nr:hypothetical protein JHK87_048441 [Glycine soja]